MSDERIRNEIQVVAGADGDAVAAAPVAEGVVYQATATPPILSREEWDLERWRLVDSSRHLYGLAMAAKPMAASILVDLAATAAMKAALMAALLPGEPTEVAIVCRWAAQCCFDAGKYDFAIRLARIAAAAVSRWVKPSEFIPHMLRRRAPREFLALIVSFEVDLQSIIRRAKRRLAERSPIAWAHREDQLVARAGPEAPPA